MADLLGATNPVPGYDNTINNRNIQISPGNSQVQNVAFDWLDDMNLFTNLKGLTM